ncbi:unnamed protein product [Tuwongella immobilis]|uniref:Uncharacterized protein n=1 Tax=Tuwongella immobilis TaxID=692036 RepID=A0A6C2YRX5_9BACT|nr:unnamed protein product [Tuwongella immobilis]VTS05589.1 unnamed protein product [Tuwongella immobilis]
MSGSQLIRLPIAIIAAQGVRMVVAVSVWTD